MVDAAQRRAVEALQHCHEAVERGGRPLGVYLWGPVGRGKTWLMDSFHRSLRVPSRRQHFHHFMRWVHRRLFQRTQRHIHITQLAVELVRPRNPLHQQRNELQLGAPAKGVENDDPRAFTDDDFLPARRLETQQRNLPLPPAHPPQVPRRGVEVEGAGLVVDQLGDGDVGQHQVAVGQGQEQAGELAGAVVKHGTCSSRRCFPAAPTLGTACRGSR